MTKEISKYFIRLIQARSPEEARKASESQSPVVTTIKEIIELLDKLHLGKK